MNIKMKRNHSEIIKAWADGAEIQCKSNVDGKWCDTINPQFYPYYKYRVKPAKRIPREVWVDCNGCAYDTLSAAKTCAKYGNSSLT